MQKKRDLREQQENKIDTGLDRTLAAITGYVKFLLAAEQKKTDFKPDDDNAMLAMVSPVSAASFKTLTTIHELTWGVLDMFC